jgi:hypothetical protein
MLVISARRQVETLVICHCLPSDDGILRAAGSELLTSPLGIEPGTLDYKAASVTTRSPVKLSEKFMMLIIEIIECLFLCLTQCLNSGPSIILTARAGPRYFLTLGDSSHS